MKNNSEFSGNGQGPGPVDTLEEQALYDKSVGSIVPPTVEVIEKWLTRDLLSVRSLLEAILTDKELRLHLATFMHGRYTNHVNRPVVDPAQESLFPN